MSGFIGPKPADVPVGTIATKGTLSGNSLVIGTNNVIVGNSVTVVSNGNVGIGTSSPAYTLQVSNGVIAASGNTGFVTDYINNVGNLNTTPARNSIFVNGTYTSNSTSPSYIGILSNPSIVTNGSNGFVYPIWSSSRIESSGVSDYIFSAAILGLSIRNSNNDISANSLNGLVGAQFVTGHNNGSNASQSYTTTTVSGITTTVQNQNGIITTSRSGFFGLNLAGVANRTASVNTHYGILTSAAVGAASGTGTGTLTNYYDAYFTGVTVNATGTVTNKYGVYQVATDHINYFGGPVGFGTTSTTVGKINLSGAGSAAAVYLGGLSSSNIVSDIYIDRSSSTTSIAAAPNIRFSDGTNNRVIQSGNGNLQFFRYSGSWIEDARIDSNGNVGIGTTSPQSKLHVANEIRVGRTDASAEGGEIKLCRSTDDAAAYSIDVYGSGTNPEFRLFNSIAGTVFFSSANSGVNYIKFNPTQNAVGDANALDDYEEGTWTPTWRAATIGNTPTFTYTSQQGRYVKIGSQVTVWCKLSWSNKTGGTADLAFISGLPFAQYNAGGQDHPGGGSINYASGLPVLCGLYADASSNYMVCMKNNAGVSYLGITTDVGTSGQIMASYTYYTNS